RHWPLADPAAAGRLADPPTARLRAPAPHGSEPNPGLEARLTGRLGPQHLMRLACSSGAAERRVPAAATARLDFLLLAEWRKAATSFCFVSALPRQLAIEDDSCLIDDEGRLLQAADAGRSCTATR
uniref:Sushi domain-containing protein n=1 Tax=Macrostomum lignano TaxID=282301 RepID=A0A1I8FKU0_9PLAT